MYFLTLDSEQAGIIVDAAHAANAILSHRSARVDPDLILSNSIKMQKIKLTQVLNQLKYPVIPVWDDLSGLQQTSFHKITSAFVNASDPMEIQTLYPKIFAHYAQVRQLRAVEEG